MGLWRNVLQELYHGMSLQPSTSMDASMAQCLAVGGRSVRIGMITLGAFRDNGKPAIIPTSQSSCAHHIKHYIECTQDYKTANFWSLIHFILQKGGKEAKETP
jgi:hypothetical protein